MTCPYPIPQAQTAPISPGVILSFESPAMELSGPYAVWDIPTLGALAPIIPLITPALSISQPVLNEVTPNESSLVTAIATLEADAGLDSAQNTKFAQELEPYWLKFVDSLTPLEQDLADTSAAQCLALFGNALAQEAAKLHLSLPPLPTLPSGVTPAQSAAVGQAVLDRTSSPFATITLSRSEGIPTRVLSEAAELAARGLPVKAELVDTPPANQAAGGSGFSDFVALAVHALPDVTAFQIDGSSTNPSGPAQIDDIAHGLAAADFTRRAGQLIGVGVPTGALGSAAPAFWTALGRALGGYQANLVDFVAAGLGNSPSGSATNATGLEHDWSTFGGVPKDVPLFATVGLPESQMVTVSALSAEIARYESALRHLHVGLLEVEPVPGR